MPLVGWRAWRSGRLVRWGAPALACLVVGAAAARLALPAVVRWALVRAVEQATGMRAQMGEIALAVARGTATLGALQVTHPRSGARVAGWEGVRVRVRFAPLLRGTVRVEALEIDRPFLVLAQEDARPAGDAIPLSAFTQRRSGRGFPLGVDLGALRILEGRLRLLDAAGPGRPIQVEDIRVELAGSAARGGAAIAVSARWEGARVETKGALDPSGASAEAALDLSVSDLDLSRAGAFLLAPVVRATGWPVAFREGRLDANARLTRGRAGGAQATATLILRRPELAFGDGRGRLAVQAVQVAVGGFDLDTFTLREGHIEVTGGEGDLASLDGTAGRLSSLRAAVGSFDLRNRSAQSVTVEVRGLAASRDHGASVLEGGRLQVAAQALDLRTRTVRGLTAEGEGLALRGVGAKDAAGTIGSLRASADGLDLAARAGRGFRLQAERVVGSGLGMAGLRVEARAVRGAADGVTPGADALRGVSLDVEGVSATGPRGPLGTVGAVRASAAALEPAGRSGAGVRVEAEQVAVAGLGPQSVSAGLRAMRAAADRVDLRAPALRGASVAVEWLAAARAGEPEPFAVLRSARLEASRVDLAAPAIDVTRLVVDAPALQVRRDTGGVDLARLLPPSAGAQGPPAAPPGAEADRETPAAAAGSPAPGGRGRVPSIPLSAVSVGLVQLVEGSVTFTDATVSPAVRMDLRELAVNLLNVHPGGDAPATLVASAKLGRAGRFEMGAQFTPGTLRNATGTARLEGIDVDVARPYLRLPSPFAAITGRVTASAEARPTAPAPSPAAPPAPAAAPVRPAWKIVARVEARNLAGRDGAGRALAEVPSLDLTEIEVAVPDLAVTVGEIAVGGFRVPVERDAAGVVRIAGMPLSALRARGAALASRAAAPGPAPAGGPPPPSRAVPPVRVRHVRLAGAIPLLDRARPYPLETALSDLVLELQDVGTVGDTAMGLQLSGRLEEMTFAGAGATRFGPLRGTAYLEVKSLDVVRWADYLPDPIRGRLADLRGSARLEATFGAALSDLAIRGQVDADQLQLADQQGNGVLGVGRAEIAIERLTLAPPAVHVRSVLLHQPWVRVERRADGRFNVLDLLPSAPARSEGSAAPASGSAAPSAAPADARTATMPVTIDRLTLREGTFAVVDRTVTPAFRDRLQGVALRVEGISPDGKAAPFELAGRFTDNATLDVRGAVAPRMEAASLELQARLAHFNLSGLSTYLRYLTSHRLERGKFHLEARYRLEGRQLSGENHVRIEQLQVGEAEEWPDKFTELVGVSLPFAVSLLQDGDGVIELDLPVRGDVARPEFDFGDAVRTAVRNAVVGVIAAPFRWVGQIFQAGGRIEAVRIDPILFEPGSDQLGGPAQETLAGLVAFLKEAPGARLEMVGYAEPEQDGKALAARTAQPGGAPGLIRRLARRLGVGAAPPAAPSAAALQGLARRRSLAAYEALLRAEIDPRRLFLREGLVEAAAVAAERAKPPQGRVEFRLVP